jgi:hypothetical protein
MKTPSEFAGSGMGRGSGWIDLPEGFAFGAGGGEGPGGGDELPSGLAAHGEDVAGATGFATEGGKDDDRAGGDHGGELAGFPLDDKVGDEGYGSTRNKIDGERKDFTRIKGYCLYVKMAEFS